jgi:hypothetical protein
LARIALAAVACLGCAVAASRAATFIHEALGHLGVAWLFGGRPAWIQVTLMGGGGASWREGFPVGSTAATASSLGGIAVNAVMGIALAAAVWRRAPGGAGDAFVRVLAAVSMVGAIHYLVAGSYYGYADSGAWPWLWPIGLALAIPSMVVALKPAADWIAARAGAGAPTFSAVALITLAGYGGIFLALRQDFAAVRARSVAIARVEKQAKVENATRAAKGEPPAPPPATPFPIEVPLGLCYVLAAGIASRRRPSEVDQPVNAREVTIALALGAAALAAVAPLRNGLAL